MGDRLRYFIFGATIGFGVLALMCDLEENEK